MLRARLRQLLVYFRRRKPKVEARRTPAVSSPVVLPKESGGVTVRTYSVHSNHSRKGPAKSADTFDFLLGFLVIGMLVVSGTQWNSRLGKLTEPLRRGSTSGHASSWLEQRGRPFWFRETARDTTPTHGGNTEDKPDLDRPPSVTRAVPASYTAEARNAGFHGKVFVTVYVDAVGTPEDVQATSPIPFGLERTIMPAVFQWRFRPALSHGVAVAGQTVVEVPFR
jgi:TonB family protein